MSMHIHITAMQTSTTNSNITLLRLIQYISRTNSYHLFISWTRAFICMCNILHYIYDILFHLKTHHTIAISTNVVCFKVHNSYTTTTCETYFVDADESSFTSLLQCMYTCAEYYQHSAVQPYVYD